MATDSNNNSFHRSTNSSFHHPRMVSFQSASINNSTGMIPADVMNLDGTSSLISLFMPAGSSMINHAISTGSILREPTSRFPHVSGSPAYWLPEEVEILNKGLIELAHESSIQKYTKIASKLPRKTIRDVALRCQWMINKENGKRRKMEEYYATKKMKNMKEKIAGSPSTSNISGPPNSLTMHHTSTNNQIPSQEIMILMDENERFMREIARNLEGGMLQENTSIFHYLRNNIIMIQNRINEMPGANQLPVSMRQMPPLPESIHDKLFNSLMPCDGNVIYTAPGSSHLQLNPTCFRPDLG